MEESHVDHVTILWCKELSGRLCSLELDLGKSTSGGQSKQNRVRVRVTIGDFRKRVEQ